MTEKELTDKLGAMHLRFLNDSANYAKLVDLLMDYQETEENYGGSVVAALKDGLKNAERYLAMESAISPRSIVIEKRTMPRGRTISKADVEGFYQLSFILDDGTKLKIRFDRKQSHLLYILMLICYQKKGLMADFFLMRKDEVSPVLQVVAGLIKLIYPHTDDKAAMQMARDFASDRSFTDCLQKLKASLTKNLGQSKVADDMYWFMPYAIKLGKKQLYRMQIPQASIFIPEEFQPVIEAMPDAYERLEQEGIDTSMIGKDLRNDFAWWKKAANDGDPEALYRLGIFYGTGDVVKQDHKQSVKFFEEADKKGCLDATFQLGVYHQFGFGVNQDIRKALSYYERAASHGHAEAASWAGQIYERGIDGVKVDHKKSFALYMIAAEQGNEEAMWYVIQGYLLGNGIKKNFGKALEWLHKAQDLEYYNISVLFGAHYFNQGDPESLDKALRLFIDGANADIPLAHYFLGRMAAKGICRTDDWVEEAREEFLKAAMCGEQMSINTLKRAYPSDYDRHKHKFEPKVSMHETFINQILLMNNNMAQNDFVELVDAYREKWHESYLAEMCKQLSIHKKPEGDDGNWTPQRRITIRKAQGGRLPYEVVLTLANGKEVIVNKINLNGLTLLLLTIICSFKSGYTTMMAASSECRPMLKALAQLVNGTRYDNYDDYVEGMMGFEIDYVKKKNEDYYKQYSNMAKNAVKAAVGVDDDAYFFLFENQRTKGKKIIRHTILSSEFIELPAELLDLANRMPDALDVLQSAGNQIDKSEIAE